MKVYNLPINGYYRDYPYVVVREVTKEYWFYGAYSTYDKALSVANEIGNSIVVPVGEIN